MSLDLASIKLHSIIREGIDLTLAIEQVEDAPRTSFGDFPVRQPIEGCSQTEKGEQQGKHGDQEVVEGEKAVVVEEKPSTPPHL